MGLNRKLFVSDRWDVEDVQDTLESLFDTKVDYVPTHSPDYSILNFTVDGDNRSMNLHQGSEIGGFKGLLMTLGASGQSDRIFKALAERLGGFYNEQDCDSNFVEYQYKAAGNLEFSLKDAVKKGATDGCDSESFREFLVKSEEQNKIWEEEQRKSFEKLLHRGK